MSHDFEAEEGVGHTEDDTKMLMDVEINIANIEKNLSLQEKMTAVLTRSKKSKDNIAATEEHRKMWVGIFISMFLFIFMGVNMLKEY